MKSLTVNNTLSRRPVSTIKKNNGIVSKNSHRNWCIIKVQSIARRWLAIRLLKKLKAEKELALKNHNSLIVPILPLSSTTSPEIITISFQIQQQPQPQPQQQDQKEIEQEKNDQQKQEEKEIIIQIDNKEQIKLTISNLDLNTDIKEQEKEKEKITEIKNILSTAVSLPSSSTTTNAPANVVSTGEATPFSTSRSSSMSSSISMSGSLSSGSLLSAESHHHNHNQQQQQQQQQPGSLSTSTSSSHSPSTPTTMRKRTIDELLKVERSYVTDMNTLIDVFYHPFKSEECFPKEYLYTLFCNIEEIRGVHQTFLESLEKRILIGWDNEKSTVGELFLPFMGSFQKLYEVYINNYEKAFAFTRYIKANPQYNDVLKSIHQKECDNRCRSLDIGSFLVIPVQRIPRYIVLLSEIEKQTPQGHPDLNQVSLALVQLRDLTLFLNESKRQFSNDEKIQEIKQSIEGGLDNTILPNQCKFIMEGNLFLLKGVVASTKKDLFIYLFKEFILCTENISPHKLKSSSLKFNSHNHSSNNSHSNNSSGQNSNCSSPMLSQSSNNGSNVRSSSLIGLTNSTTTSSSQGSPSASGNNSNSGSVHNTIRNKSLFKKILFSEIKAVSVLKNFKDTFQVVTSKKVYTFVAQSTESRDKWFGAINDLLSSITPPPSPTLPRHTINNNNNNNNNLSTTSTNNSRHSIQLTSSPSLQSPTVSKRKNRFSIQLT